MSTLIIVAIMILLALPPRGRSPLPSYRYPSVPFCALPRVRLSFLPMIASSIFRANLTVVFQLFFRLVIIGHYLLILLLHLLLVLILTLTLTLVRLLPLFHIPFHEYSWRWFYCRRCCRWVFLIYFNLFGSITFFIGHIGPISR